MANKQCPYCGKLNDTAKELVEGATPRPGDASLCLYCGEISQFDNDLNIVKIEDENYFADLDLQTVQYAMTIRKRFIEMKNETVVDKFARLARSASFHYADDSCKEWDEAHKCRREAMSLYRDNPKFRPQMDEHGLKQLWTDQFKRMKEAIEIDERVRRSTERQRPDEDETEDNRSRT